MVSLVAADEPESELRSRSGRRFSCTDENGTRALGNDSEIASSLKLHALLQLSRVRINIAPKPDIRQTRHHASAGWRCWSPTCSSQHRRRCRRCRCRRLSKRWTAIWRARNHCCLRRHSRIQVLLSMNLARVKKVAVTSSCHSLPFCSAEDDPQRRAVCELDIVITRYFRNM
eukprot:6185810-Pleurochrysis_carterae.AAC.3